MFTGNLKQDKAVFYYVGGRRQWRVMSYPENENTICIRLRVIQIYTCFTWQLRVHGGGDIIQDVKWWFLCNWLAVAGWIIALKSTGDVFYEYRSRSFCLCAVYVHQHCLDTRNDFPGTRGRWHKPEMPGKQGEQDPAKKKIRNPKGESKVLIPPKPEANHFSYEPCSPRRCANEKSFTKTGTSKELYWYTYTAKFSYL